MELQQLVQLFCQSPVLLIDVTPSQVPHCFMTFFEEKQLKTARLLIVIAPRSSFGEVWLSKISSSQWSRILKRKNADSAPGYSGNTRIIPDKMQHIQYKSCSSGIRAWQPKFNSLWCSNVDGFCGQNGRSTVSIKLYLLKLYLYWQEKLVLTAGQRMGEVNSLTAYWPLMVDSGRSGQLQIWIWSRQLTCSGVPWYI